MAEEKKDDGPVQAMEHETGVARTPIEGGGDGYDVNQPRYPAFDKEGNALGSMHYDADPETDQSRIAEALKLFDGFG